MAQPYWQSKIWGLLHDPILKPLHSNTGRGLNSFWQQLGVMNDWVENKLNPEESSKKIMKHIKLADFLTSASDRGAIGSVTAFVNYDKNGLQVSHLLSGEKLNLKIKQHEQLTSNRPEYLTEQENQLFNTIPQDLRENRDDAEKTKELYWWLWRCLPEAVCQQFDDYSLLISPAETRLPDSSIWNHASLTSAMAGALAGYSLTTEEIKGNWSKNKGLSHPFLTAFTFSPIQELIKASRKMRDFWAGSWLLHYLSAKVSWKLAQIYGPDTLLYPSLFQQPLIDHWLLEKYPDFKQWIKQPDGRKLLTAGFPNVIILILPEEKVASAIETAKNELLQGWREVSHLVFDYLQHPQNGEKPWLKGLSENSNTWQGWLDSQWQTYYTAVPIGKKEIDLKSSELFKDGQIVENPQEDKKWIGIQNQAYNLVGEKALFLEKELTFLQKAGKVRLDTWGRYPSSANVGSWWAAIFDQTRLALASVKNARSWEIPTAFGERSTVSGVGAVVHPEGDNNNDWLSEGQTKQYWQRRAGLFDGREKLNATETVKRGLHKILPDLLGLTEDQINASYPDLTAGVAGYLKTGTAQNLQHFQQLCSKVSQKIITDQKKIHPSVTQAWGIPWIDNHNDKKYRQYHPRFLNAGWLVEELDTEEDVTYRQTLQQEISQSYPANNPADWYVVGAGDGDGMSEWLKGSKLVNYQDYIAPTLAEKMTKNPVAQEFSEFIKLQKRMGPSTHSALSRALLDFSNQLVPYLTEERYAGRLIYGGGDDVLAYSNLWEWDNWLWDLRQCFKGESDPHGEFTNEGDYWQWQNTTTIPDSVSPRPLFTMGKNATISFGIIIAHHSVPMAIALEEMWEAEEEAKEHYYMDNGKKITKDAVQLRVIFGNGNVLKATAKFTVFQQWQQLLNNEFEASIFELSASWWKSHPAPSELAIKDWVAHFIRSRNINKDQQEKLENCLNAFLTEMWIMTLPNLVNDEIINWFKLASFMIRKREIKIN
ncbi:MAG: type III-B CRISPR-associated protein Cas10/Cmr2 [Cyanobacterium sp. T60_A2020_053]|nr:type III-B CRISPR-associated protein Cas10/Cmr2 [Cyanobacterium sp. T60_A2020_053]